MDYQPSRKWKPDDLKHVQLEHYLIAKSFPDKFDVEQFKKRYLERYPARPQTSILPSDYTINNDQAAKEKFPHFLERIDRATYKFIDLVDPVRNPNWSRDELILALAFYMANRPNFPSKESEEIAQLSHEISTAGKILGLSGSNKFRNPNGVYMKLMNFRRFDPDYTEEGKVGLSRGGRGDEDVWNEFASHHDRLTHASNIIRQRLQDVDNAQGSIDEEPEIADAPEGKIVTRLHRRRERSRKLVDAKKKAFKKANGSIYCEACGFDYEKTYGTRGKGFIECHHMKPVHTLEPGEKTALSDLALLCANCHRMVHAKSPWLTIEELKSILP